MAEYRIGIDLGTTNCALAWTRMDDPSGTSQILPIAQQTSDRTFTSTPLLPSFLALPPGDEVWVAGQRAKALAPELPGRVISSSKSWFVHHSIDRRASFLPLGNEEISPDKKLSAVQAAQALLQHLRDCWDTKHPEAPLRKQEVCVTVPASFDPVAQQLTLEAVRGADFPDSSTLLEEPQAAFYARREEESSLAESTSPPADSYILVVDIGGGTSDFSLFLQPAEGHLQRLAVGEHILLGGDNLDLALAHALENKLSPNRPLPPSAFSRLLTRAREIKEDFFAPQSDDLPEKRWEVAIALPGASLLKGTLRTEISARELHPILVDGFFPAVGRRETPLQQATGLREMGLPYARDPAITRHLAAFLRDRPPVDVVFFNGGSTKSPVIRERILALITEWQDGCAPREWANAEPDCAVALGAARFLHLRSQGRAIEAGAARACYLGIARSEAICILQQGAPPDTPQEAAPVGLKATLGQPVSFPLFQNSRRPDDKPGQLMSLDNTFQSLPSLETMLLPPKNGRKAKQPQVRVGLRTVLRSTGVLQVSLICREHALKWNDPWHLEFVVRDSLTTGTNALRSLPPEIISKAADTVAQALGGKSTAKITGNFLLGIAEKELSQERNLWGAGTVRSLFDKLLELRGVLPFAQQNAEALCQLMSFLLRPGRGVPGDESRVTTLLPHLLPGPGGAPKALRLQQWVALRRIASGFNPDQSLQVWESCKQEWRSPKSPSAELVLLAGALESLPNHEKAAIVLELRTLLRKIPGDPMLWRSLGRLLSRFLFHTGTDQLLPTSEVDAAWQDLGGLTVPEAARKEAAACWLRAGRRTGLREVDAEADVRKAIDRLLKTWKVDDVRRRVLTEVVPLAEADQSRLLGEAPPPGLHLEESASE